MAYPQLRQKIEALHSKYRIDPAVISQKIKKDKATAWRWLFQRTERLSTTEQQALVNAICESLNLPDITESLFRSNNILTFCTKAGLTKFEAAIQSGFSIPIPEVIIDSLFDFTGNVQNYAGNYVLFRHDKESDNADKPYIRAGVIMKVSDHDLLLYEDFAFGNSSKMDYEGHVYRVGSVVNIVGQNKPRARFGRPELWWCGLKVGSTDARNRVNLFYGYVSDLTKDGALYTDRLVMVRVEQEKWNELRDEGEARVAREDVEALIGDWFLNYLDAWRQVPIDEPA